MFYDVGLEQNQFFKHIFHFIMKEKEEGETFVGEIYMKSKYELFGVKQQQENKNKMMNYKQLEKKT